MNRPKLRAAAAWLLIIAVIVFVQYIVSRRTLSASSDDAVMDVQHQITGKYIVGLKQLSGYDPKIEKRISELVCEIEARQGLHKQLSMIPVLFELSGKETAILELDKLAADPDSVADADALPVFHQIYQEGSDSLNSSQLSILNNYGWIGKLALSQDKPDTHPDRKKILKSAFYMVLLAGVLTIAVAAVLCAGLVLFIIALVRIIKGKTKSSMSLSLNPDISFLESFAIYLFGFMALPSITGMIYPEIGIGYGIISFLAVALAILWPCFRGVSWKEYGKVSGWNMGKGFFHEAGAGILGYIAGLPLMAAALFAVSLIVKYTGEMPSHPIVQEIGGNPLFYLLLACVWAPVVEETLFRGVFFGYLRGRFSWIPSAILNGLIFAVIHPQGLAAVPVLAVIGFNLCSIREWRGSIIAPVTAHALNNGSLVLLLLIILL